MFGEWQPIETAPKKDEFLAYDPVSGLMDVCYYESSFKRVSSCQSDGEYGPHYEDFNADRATHWMPLPPPPSDGG